MDKYIKPLMAVVIFVLMQAAVSFAVLAVNMVIHIEHDSLSIITWVTLISGLLTVMLCIKPLGMIRTAEALNWKHVHWRQAPIGILACVSGAIVLDLVTELLDVPNLLQTEFSNIIRTPWGALTIAIVAPVVEELVFREALQGGMQRKGIRPIFAIGISALVFGIIHMNPAQILGASGLGVLLGILYWRTGNAVLSAIIHVANNSFCVIMENVMGDKAENFSLVEWFGGKSASCMIILFSAMACYLLTVLFIRQYKNRI